MRKTTTAARPRSSVPIVGIGASAGGLEALEQLLSGVPEASGLAFIIVQHLDPLHKDIMVELLQRITPMPVLQISNHLRVEADHVYVIPPNRDLSIRQGVLELLEPTAPRGLRLPVDFFLRALAADQQAGSIAVILSGMGSDGTLGLRAIKENAGAVFVQDPAGAKFDGMPRSAIQAGLADVVAPAQELVPRIIAFRNHAPSFPSLPDAGHGGADDSAVEKIVVILRAQSGHDFRSTRKARFSAASSGA
jgi:two-component system CheB/CheR fusion protein